VVVLKIGKSVRVFFTFISIIMWLGIWLTGFSQTHWLLYLPASLLLFSGLTGISPGLYLTKKFLKANIINISEK